MGKRVGTIVLAVVLGAVLGSAAVVFLSYRSRTEQLVDGYPLRYWIKCLRDGDDAQRKPAVASIPKFGNDAIAPLVELLAIDIPKARESAGQCLLAIGPASIADLNAALRDPSPITRNGAIATLQLFGPASQPAAPNVARLLADPDCARAAAQFFLNSTVTPDAIGVAATLVDVGQTSHRLDAVKILRKAPTDDPSAVEALARAIQSTDPAVKDAAFLTIVDHPAILPRVMPELVGALEREQTTTVARVLLVGLGRGGIDLLSSTVNSPTADVRKFAVASLVRLSPQDLAVGRALRGFVHDRDAEVAERATLPMIRILIREPTLLEEALRAPHPAERILALRAIQKIVPSRIDDAANLLDDADPKVRAQAVETLRILGSAEDVRTLRLVQSPDPRERARGLRLSSITRGWWNIDPAIAASDDPNLDVRRAAIESLGRARFSDRARDRLLQALASDPSATIRADAAEALSSWHDLGRVQKALQTATSDPDPAVRAVAKDLLDRNNANRR